MATIYTKTTTLGTEKNLILDGREALVYPFNIGSWTDARLSFFISITTAGDSNAAVVTETVIQNNAANSFCVGLKTNNATLPRLSGTNFWGLGPSSAGGGSTNTTTGSLNVNSTGHFTVVKDTTITQSANALTANSLGGSGSATSLFCTMMSMRFTIADLGGATQTIAGNVTWPSVAYTDTSLTSLRAAANAVAAGTPALTATAWHDAGVPRAIPDAIFFRHPFSSNRFRIHSLLLERYA